MICFKKKSNYLNQRFVVIINYSLVRSRMYLSKQKMLAIKKLSTFLCQIQTLRLMPKKERKKDSQNIGVLQKVRGKKYLRINM